MRDVRRRDRFVREGRARVRGAGPVSGQQNAEPSPLTERELRLLRALSAHAVPFLIVGLSADGLVILQRSGPNALELAVGDVTARVLPLSRVVVSKRAASRPKDRLVIPVLEDVLALRVAQQDPDTTQ